MLAVTLGHFECANILLKHNANVNVEDSYGFNGILFYVEYFILKKYISINSTS